MIKLGKNMIKLAAALIPIPTTWLDEDDSVDM